MEEQELEQLVDSIANVAVRMRDDGEKLSSSRYLPMLRAMRKERDLMRSTLDEVNAICAGVRDNPGMLHPIGGALDEIHKRVSMALTGRSTAGFGVVATEEDCAF